MYSYSKQNLTNEDINSVVDVLKSEFITQGKVINNFENDLKKYTNSKYCLAVNNGTSALHLAGIALGWNKNDIILTTPITFLSTSNSVLFNNAIVDFVDINLDNYCIDPNFLEDKIKFYLRRNRNIKSVIVVDFAGHPAHWDSIKFLSKKYKFTIINDNCHALGAKYKDDIGYASKYADITTQSFHPVKNITTGEGGAVITNNYKYFKKIQNLRSHGVIKKFEQTRNGIWMYSMENLGYNYRLTDFQCALGISQLKRIEKSIKSKNKISLKYDSFFQQHDFFKIPKRGEHVRHAYHLYPLLINFKKLKLNKINFFKKMLKKQIKLQVHYIPIYRQPFYKKKFNYQIKDFINSEFFYSNEVSIPMYSTLNDDDIFYIYESIMNSL